MKLAGLSIVRNESDIIEMFVRYNLQFLDFLLIIDNLSVDSTPAILGKLAAEGLPIEVRSSDSTDHPQDRLMSETAPELAARGYDHLFPLDADEFISAPDRAALERALHAIPAGHCGVMPWQNYLPTPGDDVSEPNILKRITHRLDRMSPRTNFHKIVIPCALTNGKPVRITPGSHHCLADGVREFPQHRLDDVCLLHFPVRSEAQFLSKILVGELSLRTRAARQRGEGIHWERMYEKYRVALTMTREELCAEALDCYSDHDLPVNLVKDPVSGIPPMRYPELVRIDLMRSVLGHVDSVFRSLAKTKLSNGNVSVGATPFGLIAYMKNDPVIGRSLSLYGEWACREIVFLIGLIGPGDNVVDAGAHIGTHTVAFAMRVAPEGRIFAFEPQRMPFQMLCANVALNNLPNVMTMNVGLGARHEQRQLPLSMQGDIGAAGIGRRTPGEPVQIIPLDACSFPKLKLIKIDVEGMEKQVLEGARNTIAMHRPCLFVENNKPENSAELIGQIFSMGYRCWWHFEPYYNPHNFFRNEHNIFANVGRPEINLICLPKEAPSQVKGLVEVTDAHDRWQDAFQAMGNPIPGAQG